MSQCRQYLGVCRLAMVKALLVLSACLIAASNCHEPVPSPQASLELFVANEDRSISVLSPSGELLRRIYADISGSVVIDTEHREMFTVRSQNGTVNVYPINAGENPEPLRTITGYMPGMLGELALDTVHNELVVGAATSRWGGKDIDFYDRTAGAGATPLRSIYPIPPYGGGLILDPAHDEFFLVVRDYAGNPLTPATTACINVYPRTATGSTRPMRTVEGNLTRLSRPMAMALHPAADELFVIEATGPSIYVFSRTADGNAPPSRAISGDATGLAEPMAIVIDTENDLIFVANHANDSITVYPRTASGNVSPVRTISGPSAELHAPWDMALGFE